MIKFSRPDYSDLEITEILEKVGKVLESGELVNGKNTILFEKAFSDYLGVNNSVSVNSGTSSLELSLRALGVKDREVITTTNTCTAVPNSIINAGGYPVLTDINKSSISIDPNSLKASINAKTKAVILVHMAGFIQEDIEEIVQICQDSNVVLIEDCCRSLGAEYKGIKSGCFGKISFFSFYAPKIISTGNGGMVVTDDDSLAEKMKIMRNHGREREGNNFQINNLGFNWMMDEISSILGMSQLKRIDEFIGKRRETARIYDNLISDLEYLESTPIFNPDILSPSYYRYPILLKDKVDPEGFELYCNENGLSLGHYYPMIHQTNYYSRQKLYRTYSPLTVSEALSRNLFSLPMHTRLSSKDISKITNALANFKGV